MEKFNIITDWYFCQCIQGEPKESQLFLSLLENLSQPEPGVETYYTCFRELVKTDVRMQIYAFPKVVELLAQADFPFEMANEVAADYFNNLVAIVPVNLASTFKQLFRAAYARDPDVSAMLRLLGEACSRLSVSQQERRRRDAATEPYTDTYEYGAEAMLLVLCRLVVRRQPAAAEQLGENGLVQNLFLDALGQEFGRLPLLLAAHLSLFLPMGLNREGVLKSLVPDPASQRLAEPDIIAAYCRVYYRFEPKGTAVVVGDLFREYEKLGHYKQCYEKLKQKGKTDIAEALLVIWPAALITEAVAIDPAGAAEHLGRVWQLPDQAVSRPLRAGQLFGRYYVDEEIKSLLTGMKVDDNTPITYDAGKTPWLYYSPFLFLRKENGQLYRPPIQPNAVILSRYMQSDTDVSWIRLGATVFNALRILQAIRDADLEKKMPFIEAIAHVFHVSTDYRHWLKLLDYADGADPEASEEAKVKFKLSPALSGLALTCMRQIKFLVSGFFPAAQPKLFISAFRRHRENGQNDTRNPTDRSLFREYIYPVVLIDWIYDAYLGATPGMPAARWLEFLPELYAYISNLRSDHLILTTPQKMQLAVLTRYLSPAPHPDFSAFDWRKAEGRIRGKLLEWRAHFNYFLLNQEERQAADWLQKDWKKEPNLSKNDGIAARFIRAMERFIALKTNNPGSLVGEDDRREWEKEFRHLVTHMQHTADLSRFARLRLIEVLGDPVIWIGEEDLKELIVYLLFEFGGAYDLYRLADVLLPHREGKLLELDEANRDARQLFIRAIFYTSNSFLTEQLTTQGVQDYFKQSTRALKRQVLDELLTRAAFSDLPAVISQLRMTAREKQLALGAGRQLKSAAVPIFYRPGQHYIALGQLFPFTPLLQELKSLSLDINAKRATAAFEDMDIYQTVNLFQLSPEEIARKEAY
ncbi:MAG: hypothetical protein V4577_13845, partial [Bacteroidota bacterium]